MLFNNVLAYYMWLRGLAEGKIQGLTRPSFLAGRFTLEDAVLRELGITAFPI
jgi:hypothetical protein